MKIQSIIANNEIKKQVKLATKPFIEQGLRFHKTGKDVFGDNIVALNGKKGVQVCEWLGDSFAWFVGRGKNINEAILNYINKVKGGVIVHGGDIYKISEDASTVNKIDLGEFADMARNGYHRAN